MTFFIVVIFIVIFLFAFIYYLVNKRRKDVYNKAGKKWDGIVKELSRRK